MQFIFSGIIFFCWAIFVIFLYYSQNASHIKLLQSNNLGLLVGFLGIFGILFALYKKFMYLEFLDDFMRIFCTTFSCVRDVFGICERNIFERKRICFVLKNSTNTHLSVFSRIFVASRWCNDFFTKHDLEKYFQKIHDSSGNHDWNVRFCDGNVYAWAIWCNQA